jgi:hypothetical protein
MGKPRARGEQMGGKMRIDITLKFNEPGSVKITWALRADVTGATESVFRTETRGVATDVMAR